MLMAIVVLLLVVGSVLFHIYSPWWLTPIASNWSSMDDTLVLTFWVTGIVFVLVNVFMAYSIVRYRHREGHRAEYEPENKKLEYWLTGITTVGVVAMLAPGLATWADFVQVPENAVEVEAVGQQWHWSFRYPGQDGVMGTVANRHVSKSNPFGMNPDDPNGQDDILVVGNKLHLPLGQVTHLLLRSKDVLHDFAVPQFRVKMDLIPGTVTYQWFETTKIGQYEILCEELCGMGHFVMRGHVVVESDEDYNAWISTQPTYAETQATLATIDIVRGEALYGSCLSCHGSEGQGNQILNAPKIAGQEAHYIARQLNYFKSGVRGSHKDDVFGQMMAPMAGLLSSQSEVRDVSAYIASMPNTATVATIEGNIFRGQTIYENCANCHGVKGQGIEAMNAPVAAGMSDWYMMTQLHNFKEGIRGAHDGDFYGDQMILMADTLADDSAINDVVAYINTLQ
ncbi:MAG: cytochrome c oxidase subunit II [Gammaproteobacteria bacterium]|nr:MAG: cytochrome c oxidase subunit II [Gammaproteobacteria bacterium]